MNTPSIRSTIDSIAAKFPGYGGYAAAEKRRDQDRELRSLLAQRLGECKADLLKRMKLLKDQNRFDILQIADRLNGELDLAQQKTLAAYEGYSGWFADRVVDEKKLGDIVDLDESLISVVDQIRQTLPQNLDDIFEINSVGELIELYIQRFEGRRQLLHLR